MSEWKEYKLKDIVAKIIDNRGKNPPHNPSGIPIIETASLTTGTKYADENKFQKFVSEYTYENWFRAGHPNYNDLLIATVGNGIGSVALMPDKKSTIAQNIVGLTFNSEIATGEFFYYYFNQESVQYFLKGMDIGSAQPSLKVPHLLSLDVPVPEISEQIQIAGILSSLDDKIDLLNRQNKTLEQLAETLFRQWFVEEVEESWEVGTVLDLFKLQRGFDLPSQDRIEGKYPIITSSGSNGTHNEYKIKGPGVTTGRSGLLGNVFYIDEDFWPLNTSLFIMEYKIAKPLFAYFFLKTLDIMALNGGSAVPTLNRNDVHQLKTQLPPTELVEKFEFNAKTYFQKIKSNQTQICTLTHLRETLLPKLMSGEIRVKHD